LVPRIGLKWGRRSVAIAGLGGAALCTIGAIVSTNPYVGLTFLACSYTGGDLMLPVAWAVCLDVGKKYAGVVTAIMNTSGGVSGFISGVLFGYFVSYATGWLPALGLPVHDGLRDYRYDLPLAPVTAMLLASAVLWLKIDPTRELIPEAGQGLSDAAHAERIRVEIPGRRQSAADERR
jgi:MFS family permease